MQLPWQIVEISDYAFDAPAVVAAGQLYRLGAEGWGSATAWQKALSQLPETATGFVLPLELAAPERHRQELHGYDLLVHLRFATPDGLSGLPVLLAAWQPLQMVLAKKRDLLMVAPAVTFHRLPDACQRLAGFIADASSGGLASASPSEIRSAAAGADDEAARVSYHDLANEHYAAHRLWIGYKTLLATSGDKTAKARLESIDGIMFKWEPALEAKLQSPLLRRFQAQRAHQPAPRYPSVENTRSLVSTHASDGLPLGTRVLLVDDEFDKGVAEVLLQILFHQSQFTKRLEHEWVYAEPDPGGGESWARFVCVRDADRAWHWLAYWEDLDRTQWSGDAPHQAWLKAWDAELNPTAGQQRARRTPEGVLGGDDLGLVLDSHSAGPRSKSTVVMLDLRLQRLADELYSVQDLVSYQFRRALKDQRRDIPVIMFTASRQILNLAEVLDSSADIDGWLIKEGPDIPVDDRNANSANSVAYLLDRLHLYSTLRGWYRQSFDWDKARMLAVARMLGSPQRDEAVAKVDSLSTDLLRRIVAPDRNEPDWQQYNTFLAFVQAYVPGEPFAVIQTLVARRLVLATLLWTAADPETESWDVERWDALLPGQMGDTRPGKKKAVTALYHKLNFNIVLWMRTKDLLSQLLPDELEWLASIEWPKERNQKIVMALTRERGASG